MSKKIIHVCLTYVTWHSYSFPTHLKTLLYVGFFVLFFFRYVHPVHIFLPLSYPHRLNLTKRDIFIPR